MRALLIFLLTASALGQVTVERRATFFAQPAAVAAPTFDALTYNASAYQTRGANLTGIADSKVGILSVWLNMSALSDGAFVAILYTDNATTFRFYKDSNNQLNVRAGDGATVNMDYITGTTFTSGSGFHHFIITWDVHNNVRVCYVDDVLDTPSSAPAMVDANCLYSGLGNWSIGDIPTGGVPLAACMAELYWNPAATIDLTVTANRRKWITSGGAPANLGSDGSTPTGTAPVLYVKDGTSPGVNSGTGGNFTTHGSFTSCVGP